MKRIDVKNLRNACWGSLIVFVASAATIAWVAQAASMRTHSMSILNSPGSTDSRGAITVHAAGRGNPWINLSDGRDVLAGYTGAAGLQQVLEQNLARPLALASADFDEDGVPDLIVGYAGPGGGIITLHRGNIDSIHANAPEAQQRKANGTYTDSPFLSPALVFDVVEAADFVGAGDFDADSHWDLVAAARGGNALWFHPGDGQGGFGAARRIDLPGRVTTLVTGDINRADGLTDVVVGVVAADEPKALVFESPEGALRGRPEAYGLPAAATAMALGRLDGDYQMDLAVGAGSDLIVVYGRDRKLSLDEIRQAQVPQAKIGQRSFPFAIKSAAIGDFTGDRRTGLSLLSDDGAVYLLSGGKATGEKNNSSDRVENWKSEVLTRGPWSQATQLVCARVSSVPVDTLVVVDSANHKLHVTMGSADPGPQASVAQLVSLDVEGEPMAVLPIRLNADALSDLVILRNRQSAPTMAMTQPLATFTVTNTNDSGPGSLRQAMIDAKNSPGADTIIFSIASGVQTITSTFGLPIIEDPVTIDGTTQPGFTGSPLIELTSCLTIRAGPSTIKGLVINRCDDGIAIEGAGGNVIAGNYIGTDVNGTADFGNSGFGVVIRSANNTIGGTTASARNVISGNNRDGIRLEGSGATNLVQGNYIGTDVSGTADLGNSGDGVFIRDVSAASNTIGGTVAGARNVISGNGGIGPLEVGQGIFLPSTGNLVQGNYIGTDVSGTADLGNSGAGVSILSPNSTIGGTATSARNVISGNNSGISIGGLVATGTLVQGNYIGTDVNGTADLGNTAGGVGIGSSNNTIGGTTSGAGNTIAFNGGDGIFVDTGVNNSILSNSIHSNAGLGIDLRLNGVSPNDACDADTGANNQQNFPVLTSASTTSIQGTFNSTANTTFTIQFFANASCDPSGNGEGQTFVGSMTVTTDASCNASFTFPTSLSPGQVITATATDSANNTSEFSACVAAARVTGILQFSSASFTVDEGVGSATITVARTGSSSGAAAVDYNTSDTAGLNNCGVVSGIASSRCDYITTVGRLHFAAGETSKNISIPIVDDAYAEGNETFTITLSNPNGATLGSTATATITINDNEVTNGANPIDQAGFFVRQHYIDFLNREPDSAGLDFWTHQITGCGSDQQCIELKRINVSAAFYLSIEFQETGYLVYRLYKAAYGNLPGAPVPVSFNEFLPDTQQIGQGVRVGIGDWQMQLENNKQAFATEFVLRSRFTTAYPQTLTAAQFVDLLNQNAGGVLSPAERDQLVTGLSTNAMTRGQVLRAVAEGQDLKNSEFNRAFVLMQYFGYLRRNPNDAPDTDFAGYNFWLTKLNQFNGNFVNAEMVKAFIVSIEYRQRFGP